VRGIITACAKNTVFANFFTIAILVAGTICGISMLRELFPEFSLDMISIRVIWPGADPHDIEEGICQKIEEELDGLEGIKDYYSIAAEGYASITIEVHENHSLDKVKERVRNAVDSISTFPEDAEKPVIEELILREEVIMLALTAEDGSEKMLKEWAERVKDDLRLLPEISQAQIFGARDYEIGIEISEERLREYGLTFEQVSNAVRRGNLNLSAGVLRTEGEDIRLRTIGRKYTGADFAKIEVLAKPDGDIITLDRVATIRDEFTEDPIVARMNGAKAVNVVVLKTREEDSITVANATRAYVERTAPTLPPGMRLTIWGDQSKPLQDRINLLLNDGLQGLLLVFFMLWLFLDIRLSFWVGLGMPIAATGALVIMYFSGMTLNMISLFGLIMVLGIVVDDATVMGEAVYVHRKMGKSGLRAAVDAVMEVGLPVMAAILTTIVAFLPLVFVGGVAGKFIRILPIVVIMCLVVSTIETIFMFPAHLSHLPDPNSRVIKKGWRGFGQRLHKFTSGGLEWIANHIYSPILRITINARYITLSVAITLLLLMFGMMNNGWVKYELLPDIDSDVMTATIKFAEGTPLTITEEGAKRLEAAIYRVAERMKPRVGDTFIENVYAQVGQTIDNNRPELGNHLTSVRVELLPAELRDIPSRVLRTEWEEEFGAMPGVEAITISGLDSGPPGAPIEVWLQGEDMTELYAAARALEDKLASYKGVYQIQHDPRHGKNEIRLHLKPEAAALGISVADLARQVFAGYFGEEALRLQRGRDDVRVRVRYPEEARKQLAEFETARIRTPRGFEVPLMSVADIEFGPGLSQIQRANGQRRVSVTAELDTVAANANEIFADLSSGYFEQLEMDHPGVRVELRGEKQKMRESLGSLTFTYPMALMGMFLIIATVFRSYFQPMVIMMAIPFGIIGAIAAHMLMGFPLSLMSIFGIVALSGVVVNDSIVLIDYINEQMRSGVGVIKAIHTGGLRRFRAIVLNSATTVIGLGPLISSKDIQAQFLIPMALSIGAGVAFSTLLTLVLIPSLLAIMSDLRLLVHYLIHGEWVTREEVEPGCLEYIAEQEEAELDARPLVEVTN
jgi:multidrug efflux pump subunit AcrB